MAKEFRGVEALRPRRARPPRPVTVTIGEPALAPDAAAASGARRRTILGIVSALSGLATVILLFCGLSLALAGDNEASTGIAYAAIGTSALAVLGGLSAVLFRRGTAWGIAAMVLGLAANPLVLTRLLGWISGLG
jgi:hypothetical protein